MATQQQTFSNSDIVKGFYYLLVTNGIADIQDIPKDNENDIDLKKCIESCTFIKPEQKEQLLEKLNAIN